MTASMRSKITRFAVGGTLTLESQSLRVLVSLPLCVNHSETVGCDTPSFRAASKYMAESSKDCSNFEQTPPPNTAEGTSRSRRKFVHNVNELCFRKLQRRSPVSRLGQRRPHDTPATSSCCPPACDRPRGCGNSNFLYRVHEVSFPAGSAASRRYPPLARLAGLCLFEQLLAHIGGLVGESLVVRPGEIPRTFGEFELGRDRLVFF